jgi:hypothetical protein
MLGGKFDEGLSFLCIILRWLDPIKLYAAQILAQALGHPTPNYLIYFDIMKFVL